ncbi:hypothetical protein DTL42_00280 [Bremerella cremea]|uniref:Uncharacterized protein n=1 Tax=Bremerella cremea TaxID=1031537 RepID=A0A368KZ61_9BACT|nr:hypothetical protein [Bremerella cremea]RCS56197.1 hypothetical protein DTL42_00280 [Bremerella cremea]
MQTRTWVVYAIAALSWLSLALPAAEAGFNDDVAKVLSPILEDAVRRCVPTTFQDESDWNRTHEFTKRLKVRGKWNNLKLERVREAQKHGDWVRYMGHIENPQQDVQIWVENLNVSPTQSTCQIYARVKFQGEAEYQQWVRNVRLLGVSVVVEATAKIRLDVQLDTKFNAAGLVSSAEFTPQVVSGAIDLEHFYVHRIGKAHGEVAEQIGEQLEGTLAKKLASKQDKLVRAANKAIGKELEDGTLKLDLVSFLRQQIKK